MALCLLLAGCAEKQAGERVVPPDWPEVPANIIDLTHAYDESTIFWPTDTQGFDLEVVAAGVTDQGYYYSANRFATAEHGGTHLDAPVHFYETGWTADEIPVERLVGHGVVLDVSEKAANDRDYQVNVEDFELWEKMHGRLPTGAIVLLRTGYGRFWGDRLNYLGTEKEGEAAIPELHFPGLHPSAATWLKNERSIRAIGLDTPSIDYGQSTDFKSHVILMSGNIPAFENVANLDKLPNTGFLVVALPMKIAGGSGGPLRIIAMW